MATGPTGFRMQIGTFRATVWNIDQTKVITTVAAEKALEAAADVFYAQVRVNAGYTDHTLADLARMDHPYARRHGSIRIHKGVSKYITPGENIVHSQSGKLLQSLYKRGMTNRIGFSIGFDPAIAPHASFVTQGTKVMLPRDPLWATATAQGTIVDMMKAVVRVLGKELRSKSTIRFEF